MRLRISNSRLLLCLLLGGMLSAVAQDAAPVAEKILTGTRRIGTVDQPWRVRVLPTASFPDLPAAVRSRLDARHCMVPQSYQAHRVENVVHGNLYASGRADWAALCAADGEVTLLAFDGGTPQELMRTPIEDTVGFTGKSREPYGFALALDAIPPQRVRQFAHNNSSGLDALELSIVDGNSVIHQWDGSHWVTFAGAQL